MKYFYQILVNTLVANVTAGFLWFAMVFWIYLETQSVLATGIVGGIYMLAIALFSIIFGTIVDNHKKKSVFLFSSIFTLVAFTLATLVFIWGGSDLLSLHNPLLWVFVCLVLAGVVIEHMRNIALSTTVTLLVKKDRRANANGLVGTVGGIGFIITSVFSGLAIGFLGMGWVLAIALVLTAIALLHVFFVQIPEKGIARDPSLEGKKVDIRGSIAAIVAIPGLFGLLVFSTFNNFIGGAYMALLDPYGLTLFSVEIWGIIAGVTGTGFVIGGILIAKFGLGKHPLKTLLRLVIVMGIIGALFTIREWPWLLVAGIWLYMLVVPAIEAAEQTIIQRVVPLERQGRVFGFASAFESAAAPITAFLVAPIAEYIVIPYMKTVEGQASFGWLVGTGDARGMALVFVVSGIIMILAASLAFFTKSYKKLSKFYQQT